MDRSSGARPASSSVRTSVRAGVLRVDVGVGPADVDEPVAFAQPNVAPDDAVRAEELEVVTEQSGRDDLGAHELDSRGREALLEEAGRDLVRSLGEAAFL